MHSSDEISSTEKLLDLIRTKEPSAPLPPPASAPLKGLPGGRRGFLSQTGKFFTKGKSISIGVDIGHVSIRLAKAAHGADGWKLLDCTNVPFPFPKSSPQFPAFVRAELDRFGNTSNSRVWAIISAAQFEVHRILIPKVEKKQIENVVFWSLKKEAPFEEKDTIFDYELLEEVTDRGVPKFSVAVYKISRRQVNELRELFSKAGINIAGITTTPFAVQNIFRTGWMETPSGTVATLFIGNNFSRIDLFADGKLVMTRGIKAGANSMIDALVEHSRDRWSTGAIPALDEEAARSLLFSLNADSAPVEKTHPGFGMKEKEVFDIILPAVERLVRQVERTFEHYKTDDDKIDELHVSGVMNVWDTLMQYIGEQLGIRTETFDPLEDHDLRGVGDRPVNTSDRIAFAPALGAALSLYEHTPNLIYTHKDRKIPDRIKIANQVLIGVLIATSLVLSGMFGYQVYRGFQKEAAVAGLQQKLSRYQPRVDRAMVTQMAERAREKQQFPKAYSKRYISMAVISEIAALTPPHIQLYSLRADFGAVGTLKMQAKTAAETVIELDGVVAGKTADPESAMGDYIMALNGSPLFQRVAVKKNKSGPGDLVQFSVSMNLNSGTPW